MYQRITVIKRHALRWLLSLAILLFFILHATSKIEWDFINALEHQAYDMKLELTLPNTEDDRIVIVDIDEKSLSEIGRWPWNRSVMAKLIDQLFDTYQINVLGINVVFVEPDDSSGLKKLQALAEGPLKNVPEFLKKLKHLKKTMDYDELLAKSMKNRRIVLGYAFTTAQEGKQNVEAGQLPPPIFTHEQAYNLNYITAKGFAANLPKFQASAMTAGHFNIIPDSDGIVRRVPLFYGYKGQLYESLSLAVTRLALGTTHIELLRENQQNLHIDDRTIPFDKHLQTLIPYRGKWGKFSYVSATDVLHERLKNPHILTNKIVLIGATAQGLWDSHATPVEKVYPDIEIHATLISGILDNHFMSHLPYEEVAETLLLILIGIVMISLLPLFSPLTATIGTLALSGLILFFNLLIWDTQNVVLPLAITLLLILTLFIFNMSYGYIVEFRNKHHLTKLFGQYVPPELVDEMNKNLGNNFSMEGQSREMTVLFSDVRDFTAHSEGLKPKEISQLMNEYLTPMTQVIHKHRGTIDKYMGDAIMAFWGAPLHDSQHARHTLEASMEMLKHVEKMRSQFRAKGWPELRIGIGVNTGYMNVGNMGSQFRMAYTILGDAVNLGSRLEGATKQYGVQIIVSETTKAAVPEYVYRQLDRVRVKGRRRTVTIFEPIGLREQVDESVMAEIADYEQALEHYQQQRWEAAKEQFTKLAEKYPECRLYKYYAQRVEFFMENPPGENWDGVYTFSTKES